MSSKWRRFEVMLPRQFNDGREVPGEWISRAILEIGDHFGAVSYETQIIEGHWQHAGIVYRDNLARIVVDVPDKKEHRAWMKAFKSRWKDQLEQLELWMVSYRIELE
ncbi:MAG: hypothetical protein ACJ8F7_18250 [Gemmataceae bacterium]